MATVDFKKEIRRAVDTGKVLFGLRAVEKNLLKGKGKLLVLTVSLPKLKKEKLAHATSLSAIPFYDFEGSSKELGAICGKPFIISTALVLDAGKSKVLSVAKQEKQSKK